MGWSAENCVKAKRRCAGKSFPKHSTGRMAGYCNASKVKCKGKSSKSFKKRSRRRSRKGGSRRKSRH